MDRINNVGVGASLRPRSLGIFVLIASLLLMFSASPAGAADRDTAVGGNTGFAFDLYKQLAAKGPEDNIFFSPFSISTALAMTYAGARGNTEKQMAQALHCSLDQKRLHPALSVLLSRLKGDKDYELAIANRLWGQKDYKFLPDFLKIAQTYYQGGFDQLDFAGNTESSRKTINEWVERKTKQKITELLIKGDMTSMTRLVLTNAIYFKGTWVTKFDPGQTRDAPFLLHDDKASPVPMMSQKGRFNYLENGTFQLVELPYAGNRLSMVILLPKRSVDLANVERMLSPENLRQWRSSMAEEEVALFLPKFKTTMRFVLNEELMNLGMKDAFNEMKADFSGMIGRPGLYISLVAHKAFVDVNEEGTEAAAAAAVVMALKSVPRETIFRADHPFIFAILDKESGSVLFFGRLMNPREG